MHPCSLSITYACPYHNPTATMGHLIHNVDISKPLTHMTPSALYSENRDSSVKRTPLQSARCHRMWAYVHSSRLQWRIAVRSRTRWGWQTCRRAYLWRFLTVCEEILCSCKPIVAAAVRVAGLRRSWRWRCWMWRSCTGVVTRGLQVVRPVGCTAKFSETLLEMACGREINIQFTGNSSDGHSCSQHANCMLPQNLRHLWHCAVW